MPTILITGCSTGIGHAAAELFAERGWNVIASGRRLDELKFANPAIRTMEIDVNDTASIDRGFSQIDHLDVVVNNAGYGLLLPFEDTPPEEIEKIFRTNVFGLMEVSRRAAKMMREQKSGKIINISSILGTIGVQWYSAYGATKWAVEGFSESLGHELKPFNVHVKIIEPSGTKTAFHHVAYDTGFPISPAYKEPYEKKRSTQGKKGSYDSAESIAELIWQAANDDSWKLRYSAPQVKRTLFWQRLLGRDGLWRRL